MSARYCLDCGELLPEYCQHIRCRDCRRENVIVIDYEDFETYLYKKLAKMNITEVNGDIVAEFKEYYQNLNSLNKNYEDFIKFVLQS